jgi:HD-GYP domain-containing protein (c-di-GMP phosphodiesterase class II)
MADHNEKRIAAVTEHHGDNGLLSDVDLSVNECVANPFEQIRRLTQIGAALSAERNIERLLEMIVEEARRFTNADGGTLYIMGDDESLLHFAIVQNDSLNIRMGGTSGAITWAPVDLYHKDGSPNFANVSSYAALSGNVVNISDVYHAEEFNFEGTRQFDSETGYRSRSMLVVPLRNHDRDIIGILQLLNAQDLKNARTISFSRQSQELTESLASQAAIALSNNRLIKDLENLFESFVKTIAAAIDEKSPYTGDHGRRVVELTMMIAEKMNNDDSLFQHLSFNKAQMNELRIAAWLHDVGKVAVPEYVMDKSTKLTTVCDRLELLKTRFEVLKRDVEIDYLKHKPAQQKDSTENGRAEYEEKIGRIDDDLAFLAAINDGGEFMADDDIERLSRISEITWSVNGTRKSILSDDEITNLSIRRGTLTDEERVIINNHAAITVKMLSQMPFPKKLKNVPQFAGAHHECLNGEGYPYGLKGDEIPIQARILALADVFEALTASDRPYRSGNTLSQAIKILGVMVRDNHLDSDIFDLFVKEKIYHEYAVRELNESQIDEVDIEGRKSD